MKNILYILFALLTIGMVNAQTATHDEVISKKKKGKFQTYVTAKGEHFSVGDTITLGVAFRNENYDFIQQNAGISYYPLPNTGAGSELRIKKIKTWGKSVLVHTTKPKGYVYGLIIINFESAVANGEIVSEKMDRKQAIVKLKESKDLLDLEIISQQEYDKIKSELAPIIKGV